MRQDLVDRYSAVSGQCEFRLTGHPKLSMAEQLAEASRWAGSYAAPDVYGEGEVIESFQADMAAMLGKPAAVFLVSGTMAQAIALRIWAERAGNKRVGFHATSHLELHEDNAYRELHGLERTLLGDPQQVIQLKDLQASGKDLAAILLELPMREIGGQLPSWDALQAQSDWARANGVALHMDGARLWQCEPYYQRPMAEIAALFDSVYVSFYKDIGGIAGSVLAGPEDFIAEAKTWIARAGGNLYALYPYILTARAGLERNLASIPESVATAGWLASQLAELGLITTPAQPPTNVLHLSVNADPNDLVEYAIEWSERSKVFIMPLPSADKSGGSVVEFSIGQAVQQQPREQWQDWLVEFYGNLPVPA